MGEGEFVGRTAIVTGGTSGIGEAVAARLAAAGAEVLAIGIEDPSTLTPRPERVAVHRADVRDAAALVAAVAQVTGAHGRLDVLVCSAGVQTYGTVVDLDEEAWDRTIDTNLKGMFLAAKAALPVMIAQGRGAIVNVGSVQAEANQVTVAAYAASKAGIRAFSRGMAIDHAAQGIRVNSVSPGAIDTPMLRWAAGLGAPPEEIDDVVTSWGHSQPIGRVGTAAEVAEVVAFLASDRAAFVTGSDYRVDGGLLAVLGGVQLPS